MVEAEKNPFEAVRAMMLENLEKVGGATQSYIDMVERTMRAFPGEHAFLSSVWENDATVGDSFRNDQSLGRVDWSDDPFSVLGRDQVA